MGILKVVLTYILTIYLVILIGRMIFSWIQMFARQWVPTGIILVIAETIFTLTDPPLKFLRRYIRPLRIGTVAHGSQLHGAVLRDHYSAGRSGSTDLI